jgi:hypothetical protein
LLSEFARQQLALKERRNKMGRTIWRGFRTAVSLGAGLALKTFFNQPVLIWATPILNAIGKYLRDKHPKTWDWLPF